MLIEHLTQKIIPMLVMQIEKMNFKYSERSEELLQHPIMWLVAEIFGLIVFIILVRWICLEIKKKRASLVFTNNEFSLEIVIVR